MSGNSRASRFKANSSEDAFAASRSKKFVGNLRSIRPEQLGHRLGEDQPTGFELDGLSRLDELIERMGRRRNAIGKKICGLEAIVGLSAHAAGEERLERHV